LEKGRGHTPHELLEETSIYQGDLLPGFYDDWVILERERLRAIFDRKMHRLLQCLISEQSWEDLIQQAERWISLGETPEPAYRALMIAYASLGDKSKALAAFRRCVAALDHELGVLPTDVTLQLEKKIRSGAPLFPVAEHKGVRGYELKQKLGSGGYGQVFTALQAATGRSVAVKVIFPQYANDPEFIRRFEIEAQNIARIEHPFIVPLYDYWREPDGAYLVTRLLDGGNLEDSIKSGPYDINRAVSLVEQLSDGLHAAHQHGLVHQRLKPTDVLFDQDGHAFLSDLTMAGLLGNSGQSQQTAYTAPELRRKEQPTPRVDIYSLGVIIYHVLGGELPEGFIENGWHPASLLAQRPELPQEIDRIIQRATATDPDMRYSDALSLADDFRRAVTGASLDVSRVDKPLLVSVINPYKGLAAFDEGDAPFFFGREALVGRLLERLGEDHPYARFLAVVGPSGSGKSSLVKAGLIPALRAGALLDSDKWYILKMTPGSHPFEELEINLLRISNNSSLNLMEQLRRDERGLLRAVRLALPGDDTELLLVIDQFEETFTLVEDRNEMERFLNGLYIASMDRRSPLRVVITLRADFYDRPLMHENFSKLVQDRTEVIVPMTVKELEQAIRAPSELMGINFDPDLVTAMVLDGKEHPDALPLLQFALTELFERRKSNTLTLDGYHSMGGMEGVLERSAEAVYQRLDPIEQEIARQLFLRLVTLGEGVEDTRRRVLRSELEALTFSRQASFSGNTGTEATNAGENPFSVGQVIDLFGKARLLSFNQDPLTRSPSVEITHEALLREWPRLRVWLDDGRTDVRTQRSLAAQAGEWDKAGRDSSFLLHGVRLSQFESWAAETNMALTGEEHDYLEASLKQREAQLRAEEERKAHLAALERRSRNVLRTLVGVFAAAAIVAFLLSLFAFNQQRLARQAQALASSRELSAVAINTLEQDPELSILISLEALRVSDTSEAIEAVRHSLKTSRVRMTFNGHSGWVLSVQFSPDGSMVASASKEKNEVIVWEAITGQELARLPGIVARFSPDGSRLATGGGSEEGKSDLWDTNVYLWDTSTWKAVHTMQGHAKKVQDIHFNPQGTLLASASTDETFIVWEASSGRQLLSGPASVCGYETLDNLAFSPDGKLLFAADYNCDASRRFWQ
jgi:serine/threonine protein kinase